MFENQLEIYMAIHECNMFLQDGASCYRLQLVSDFLQKIIKMLDWLGNSTDLNLIENFWAILKDKVEDEHPTSAKDLKVGIKRICTQKITAKYCKHLVQSMPCRLQAVIKQKRGTYLKLDS